ncbi:GNAT family N-acetyltransferase [Paenibacillus sp. MBLB4367]|uniref:GNAT family N-acetyltransferase n=1 Tax=Paenibacillus sp. MBLB4367 TaxID=3384767 RepID=UPI0039082F7D
MADPNPRKGNLLQISKAMEQEIEQASTILEEAAIWLKKIDQEMWSENQYSVAGLLKRYGIGNVYIGRLEDQAAATMILQEEDPMWSDIAANESLFLHKLAVKRQYAKNGCSQEMIECAKRLAITLGKSYVRLDCAADRPKLCDFYERNGFVRVREQLLYGKYPTAFYECKVR